jgi:hypothetical protein
MVSFTVKEHDWVILPSRKLRVNSDYESMIQGLEKIFSTDKQNVINGNSIPFRYNPNYGNNLRYIKALNPLLGVQETVNAVRDEVRDTVINYTRIQKDKIASGLGDDGIIVDAVADASKVRITEFGVTRDVIKWTLEINTKSGKVINKEDTAFAVN